MSAREELSEQKRQLLRYWLEEEGVKRRQSSGIPRRQSDAPVRLSFGQERLWVLSQLEPGSQYNDHVDLRLAGPLDMETLERSWNAVVERHEVLRTTFRSTDEGPLQVIHEAPAVSLPVVDLSDVPASGRMAQARRLAVEEIGKPFDLEKGPLWRVQLLRLGSEEHILHLTAHHIVIDGWSYGVLLRDLFALYEGLSKGDPSPLRPLPIQYADFALWQRQMLSEGFLENQIGYWKRQLDGAPALLELPADRRRPPVQSFRGAREFLRFPKDLTEGLRALSRREGCTFYMTLLAAFQVLLHRYTGQEDITVGSPVAGRQSPETADLIGFFVNTLVLRTQLSGDPTFREVLARVRDVALGAFAHQDLPFEKLVGELQPERTQSHHPLFQVLFILLNASMPSGRLGDLVWSPLESESGTAKFDLALSILETDEGLSGWVEYATDLFDPDRIGRLIGHFRTLLEAIVADPAQRVATLPLLTPVERRQLLVDWNATETDYPRQKCIHQLFEAQVERTPGAEAVVFGGRRMSYGQLNEDANRLAGYLSKRGVGPEVLVGLCVERSLEMVVGLLGILKAGGAYVPLDPAYPKQRLAFMLEDSGARVVLTQESLLESLPDGQFERVRLDADWKEIARERAENLPTQSTSGNLAYVIYTSGSTGRPKGVAIEHRSAVTLLHWARDVFSSRELAGVLASTSICFDLSIFELFVPLSWGGKVILAENALDLPNLPAAREVTLVNTVPSAMAELVRVGGVPDSVSTVNLAGEPLQTQLVQQIYQQSTIRKVFDLYGPSEDTTYSTFALRSASGPATIGRPVGNTQVYVLDRCLQPVPIGVPGELHIGGEGLARGYLNRPELTAEKFIPNPFSNDPDARLYKTGDFARYLPDGNIEFLARLDHQVKIRGYRIELGEIEAALRQHTRVRESVVLAREDISGEKRLVAYLVVDRKNELNVSELCSFLKETLPDYMVPSAFVFLDSLPVTPNGKVDRRALPAPDQTRPDLEETYVAPRTSVEEVLAGIWAELLGLERVGVHDNFFELGGDSILSLRIVSRANQAGLRLTPTQLFRHQTIAELAGVADTTQAVQAEQALVLGPVPLTPIQRWFVESNFSNPHHWNLPMLLEACQPLNAAVLERALACLLEHHDALRLRFLQGESGWQQVNGGPERAQVFTRVDLSALSEQEQGPAMEGAAADLQKSLNLSEGPLVRAALFELGSQRPSRLLLVVHHLAIDGVSWRILVEDLQRAYMHMSRGEPITLSQKTTSFQQWSRRLTEHAQSGALRAELPYWLGQSDGPVCRLPVDYAGGVEANTEGSARTVSLSLTGPETLALLQQVPQAYQTQIDEVLLTALVQTLAPWTGAESLLIDLEGHGREEVIEGVDLSRTVGWFTSLFPVRLRVAAGAEPAEALKSVKKQLRAIPNRGIGYGLLRYLSGDPAITTRLRAQPQAEVVFNYLGQFDHLISGLPLMRFSRESLGPCRSPRGTRRHLFQIDGLVADGRLHLQWGYSDRVHRPDTVERLAQRFVDGLRTLIAHCRSSSAGAARYTPADFPLVELQQQQLDTILAAVSKKNAR